MATERGIVIEVDNNTAWVKTEQSGECESCCSKGSCLAIRDGDDMKVLAINTAGAASGDRVVLSFGSSSLFKVTFFLYMFPILCLIGGVFAGMKLAPLFNMEEQTLSAITGISCFLGSFFIIKARGGRMSQKDEYKPRIIRIVRRH